MARVRPLTSGVPKMVLWDSVGGEAHSGLIAFCPMHHSRTGPYLSLASSLLRNNQISEYALFAQAVLNSHSLKTGGRTLDGVGMPMDTMAQIAGCTSRS